MAAPEGAQLSEDGQWWWDEAAEQWQAVDESSSTGSQAGEGEGDGEADETEIDWSELPELWALMEAGDYETWMRDVVGVDPDSLTAEEAEA